MEQEPLPRHDFVGPHQGPELLANARSYLETRQPDLPPEIPRSPELDMQLSEMAACIIEYGTSIGLDLRNRTISPDRVHVFGENSMEEIYKAFPHQRGTAGARMTTGDLLALEQPTIGALLQVQSHETIHEAAIKDQYLTPENGKWEINELRGGFSPMTNDFRALDEYYTEKIHRKIVANHWPGHDALSQYTELESTARPDAQQTYNDLWDFGLKLDQYISDHVGPDTLLSLERAYFTGDYSVFHTIAESLGPNFVSNLAAANSHEPKELALASQRLGI